MEITSIPGFVPPGGQSYGGAHSIKYPIYQKPLFKEKSSYLSWFYHNEAYNQAAITQVNEFVSHYSAPVGMRAGFWYYKAFPHDAIENQNYSKTKLAMPVLALSASYYPAFGGNISIHGLIYGMKILAQDVRAALFFLSSSFRELWI